MILLLLLTLSISSLFGLPATFGNPPSDPACDALRTVADSLTGARIYGSLCADSIPKTECTTASLEVLKNCLDGIHVDQDCLDRMHTNLTEVSMDDQDCFCGGLVKFSDMLTSVKALLCIEKDEEDEEDEEDEVRAGMGSFSNDKGFGPVWKACTGGNCNSAGSGEVKSPGYPNTYGNDLSVSITIEVASGSKIELTFVDIDIEDDAFCGYDYVQVLDTDNTELLKKCGTGLPEKIVSKGNKLTVKFMTDYSVIAKGFRAKWREVTGSVTLGNSEGSIKSPDFPNNYPNNKDKEWDLSAPGGSKIQLTFNSFDLEDDASCSYDYVQISYGTFSKKYCGASKPDPVTSTGNTMNVKFHSDDSVVKKGFSAVWKDYVQGENSREKLERMVVISSMGGTAQHNGGLLGQFEYDEEDGGYIQSSTDQSNEKFQKVKLYSSSDVWKILVSPSKNSAWLMNPTPSKSLPTSGWQYYVGKTWQDDPTLTISPGPLPPLARQFTVTATGAAAEVLSSYLGVFTRTQRWWLGRPVYTNPRGRLLHHGHGDYGWMIGSTLGSYSLRGSRARHSPASEDNWRYWTGSEDKPASVTVTASD